MSAPTVTVDVPDIGQFTFMHLAPDDRERAAVTILGVTFAALPTGPAIVAGAVAILKLLTLAAPAGWDLDELDLTDAIDVNRLSDVLAAFGEAERIALMPTLSDSLN